MGSWGHGLLGSDLGSWGQTWEAVQEFPLEIHKSLPSNGLRISSLIKVVSLLARTYGKKRRILGQPPSPLNASVHAISLLFSCEGSDSPSGHSLGPVLQHETGDAGEVADVARDQNSLVF